MPDRAKYGNYLAKSGRHEIWQNVATELPRHILPDTTPLSFGICGVATGIGTTQPKVSEILLGWDTQKLPGMPEMAVVGKMTPTLGLCK